MPADMLLSADICFSSHWWNEDLPALCPGRWPPLTAGPERGTGAPAQAPPKMLADCAPGAQAFLVPVAPLHPSMAPHQYRSLLA